MTDWYKIKRVLTWVNWVEKQIYPATFEFSYDFRNKTATDLSNDWWTNTSWVMVNSYGVTNSSWKEILLTIPQSLANANKITFESQYYDSWGSAVWTAWAWIWDMLFQYIDNSNFVVNAPRWEIVRTSYSHSVWYKTYKSELDLVNKTWVFSWDYSWTSTLTDSDVTALRNANQLRVVIQQNYYVSNFKLTVV